MSSQSLVVRVTETSCWARNWSQEKSSRRQNLPQWDALPWWEWQSMTASHSPTWKTTQVGSGTPRGGNYARTNCLPSLRVLRPRPLRAWQNSLEEGGGPRGGNNVYHCYWPHAQQLDRESPLSILETMSLAKYEMVDSAKGVIECWDGFSLSGSHKSDYTIETTKMNCNL